MNLLRTLSVNLFVFLLVLSTPALLRADILVISKKTLGNVSSKFRDAIEKRSVEANRTAGLLAITTGKTIAECHYELAQGIVASEKAPEKAVELVQHLRGAAKDQKNASICHRYLGEILFVAGEFKEAAEELKLVADEAGELRLLYARTLLALNRVPDARKEAQQASKELVNLARNEKPGSKAELYWLDSLEFLEDFKTIEKHLLTRERQGEKFASELIHSFYFRWSQYLSQRKEWGTSFEKALVAYKRNSNAESHWARLLQAIVDLQQLEVQRRVALCTPLEELSFSNGKGFQLGSTLCEVQCYGVGLELLGRVYEQKPQDLGVLNNLAHYTAAPKDGDLDLALKYANELVENAGKKTQFWETRGQIYAKRGEWGKAKKDLMFARKALPEHPELYLTLSTVCKMLNEHELSDLFKDRFEALAKKRKLQ